MEFNATILTHTTQSLRKSYYVEDGEIKCHAYPRVKYFESQSTAFLNIHDFWKKFQALSQNHNQMLIRGVAFESENNAVRRIMENFHEPDHGSNWFQIDIDGFTDIPSDIDPLSVDAIEYFIPRHLPPEFHSISYVYQFSNSAGILNPDGSPYKPGINVHLYFFTSRNVMNMELKGWIPSLSSFRYGEPHQVIDHSLFHPVTSHYTALPDIGDGIVCRLGKRQDFVFKDWDCVEVPDIIRPMTLSQGKRSFRSHGMDVTIDDPKVRNLLDTLKSVGCIHSTYEKTVNIWHKGETSKGGYFIYFDKPHLVYHPTHEPMRLDEWLETYWDFHNDFSEQLEPYYQTNRIPPEIAQQKLRELITQFKTEKQSMIIKASAGLGKSTEAVSILFEKGNKIHFLVPTHVLAQELYEKIQAMHPDLTGIIVKGRSQEGMCRKSCLKTDGRKSLIEELSKKGFSVYSHLCRNEKRDDEKHIECESSNTCPYLKQFDNTERYDYVILIHNYLINAQAEELRFPEPDYVVIDESFWKLFTGYRKISLAEMSDSIKDASEIEKKILRHVRSAVLDREPVLDFLRTQGVTKDEIREAKRIAGGRISYSCGIHPGMTKEEMIEIFRKIVPSSGMYRLFSCLFNEYDRERAHPHSIVVEDDMSLSLHYRKELQRYRSKDITVLVIDADADEAIIKKVLKRDFQFYEIDVMRKSEVIQVYSTTGATYRFMKTGNTAHDRYADEMIEETNMLVSRESKNGKRVLVICPQKIEEMIQVPEHCAIEHFGDFRGMDKYRDFDSCIVVGRNQPPLQAVEAAARSIFYDDEEEIHFLNIENDDEMPQEVRGYSCKEQNRSTKVVYHPDHRCDKILKQIRECETVQAASRIRDIWNSGKKIILLSNLVVDLEIDKMVSWKELMKGENRFERMIDEVDWNNEVLPLSGKYVASRFSSIWKDENQFNNDKFRLINRQLLYSILYKKLQFINLYSYKQPGQKRWSEVISIHGIKQTKQLLEKIFGNAVDIKFKRLSGSESIPFIPIEKNPPRQETNNNTIEAHFCESGCGKCSGCIHYQKFENQWLCFRDTVWGDWIDREKICGKYETEDGTVYDNEELCCVA